MTGDTAHGSLYDGLRRRIVSGVVPPGAQMAEDALAEEFGVGVGPVREALGRLAYDGLVERREGTVRVRELRQQDVLDLYDVRIALERLAARAAAERRTDVDLQRLTGTLDTMLGLDDQAVDQRPGLAHALHFDVWQASHNPALIDTLQSVHIRVMAMSTTTLHHPQRWVRVRGESEALVAAIAGGDVDRAGEVAETQMAGARDFRIELYGARG